MGIQSVFLSALYPWDPAFSSGLKCVKYALNVWVYTRGKKKQQQNRKVEIPDLPDSLHIKSFPPHWRSLSSWTQKPHRFAGTFSLSHAARLGKCSWRNVVSTASTSLLWCGTPRLCTSIGQRPGQIVEFKIVFIEGAQGLLCGSELGTFPVGHYHSANLLDSLRAWFWRQ